MRRREILTGGLAITQASFLQGVPWFGFTPAFAAGNPPALSVARLALNLEVCIGSLVGAGLGEAVYANYARAAPARLVATFREAIRGGGGNLARPSKEYVEFRVSSSGNSLPKAAATLQIDVASDAGAFHALGTAVAQQSMVIVSLRQAPNTSLSEFRDRLQAMRKEVEVVRLEQDRANMSNSVYTVTQDEIEITGVERSGGARKQIDACKRQALMLETNCRQLAELLSKVG